MPLKTKLAAYVLSLEDCVSKTHRAEDRALYEKYLADAAGILAFSVFEKSSTELHSRISSHERLWGNTWLQDEVYKHAADAWKAVKQEAKFETT